MFQFFKRIIIAFFSGGRVVPEPSTKEEPIALSTKQANAVARYNGDMSQSFTDSHKAPALIDYNSVAEIPESAPVWMYNVSKMNHEVYHPQVGKMTIPAKDKGTYAVFTSFPSIMKFPVASVDDAYVRASLLDGRRFCMDLINPDNLGLDQTFESKLKYLTSSGNNLGVKGVFWSLNNPPLPAEISAATKRMKKRYKRLLEEAGVLEFCGPSTDFNKEVVKLTDKGTPLRAAREAVGSRLWQITPEHHAAAECFKVTTTWHPVLFS